MKKKKIMGAIKFAVLLLIALTQLFPLYWLITFSLKSNTEIFGENVIGLPHVWRWDNYVTALSSSNLIRYFLNSVFYSVVTVVAAGIISSMAAYAISRMIWKLRNLVYGLFMIGIMIPAQAALLPLFQILDRLGLKGGYLGLLIPYIAGALPMSIKEFQEKWKKRLILMDAEFLNVLYKSYFLWLNQPLQQLQYLHS